MRSGLLVLTFVLTSCGDAVTIGNGAVTDNSETAQAPAAIEPMPVRVGEHGANFKACSAAGTTRNLAASETLPVRSAPFEYAEQSASIAAGTRFFVCSRSLDEKWFGVVWDEGGTLAGRCGVTKPVARRTAYAGPCRSGWVQSAFVKLIAGLEQPAQENQLAPATAPGA
jgi:hypothetical protein